MHHVSEHVKRNRSLAHRRRRVLVRVPELGHGLLNRRAVNLRAEIGGGALKSLNAPSETDEHNTA
jgi:hypothetical protein